MSAPSLVTVQERQRESAKARNLALRLLAQREHGRAELEGKLLAQGYPAERVAELLHSLGEEGLQSDERFAAALVRRRIDRGYGPAYIRQELHSRQVDKGLAEAQLDQPDAYWAEVARRALVKKFPGWAAAREAAAVQREAGVAQCRSGGDAAYPVQARFLARRGFPADLVYRLLR